MTDRLRDKSNDFPAPMDTIAPELLISSRFAESANLMREWTIIYFEAGRARCHGELCRKTTRDARGKTTDIF